MYWNILKYLLDMIRSSRTIHHYSIQNIKKLYSPCGDWLTMWHKLFFKDSKFKLCLRYWNTWLRVRVSSSQTYPWFPIPSGLGTQNLISNIYQYITTVDGWNPANQLRLVVYPIIYRVSAPQDFSHQQYHALSLQMAFATYIYIFKKHNYSITLVG